MDKLAQLQARPPFAAGAPALTPRRRSAPQYLSLVNKVTTELDNHLGVGDKTLAEFVIALSEGCATPAAFHSALAANGADLPPDFCATLLTVITRLRPARPGGAAGGASVAASAAAAKPTGLALPDNRDRASAMSRELYGGRNPLENPRHERGRERAPDAARPPPPPHAPPLAPPQRRPALPGRAAARAGGEARARARARGRTGRGRLRRAGGAAS